MRKNIKRVHLEFYKMLLYELYFEAMKSQFRSIIIGGIVVEKAELIGEEINLLDTILEL